MSVQAYKAADVEMPRRNKKKIAEEVDHAFELAFILVNVVLAILGQYVSTEQTINIPPIIANIRRLSIAIVFPSILTIIAWITIHFIDDETWKMRLRTYAWSSVTILMFFESIEFYVICRSQNYPLWMDHLLVLMVLPSLIFPIIPAWLMKKVLNRYQTALKDVKFFMAKGKIGSVTRYAPFCLSYITFWMAFFAAASV